MRSDYKTPLDARLRRRPNRHWRLRWAAFGLGCVVLGVVMAKSQAPDAGGTDTLPREAGAVIAHESLALPDAPPASAEPNQPKGESAVAEWRSATVDQGDTFARLLQDAGIASRTIHSIATAGEAGRALARIYPGDRIRLGFDEEDRLIRLRFRTAPDRRIEFERAGDSFTGRIVKEPLQRRLEHARGVVRTSLFEAGADAGMEDRIIMNLVRIFRWDIDFIYGVRRGDRFMVVYEAFYKNGHEVRTGNIVAAEFINQGQIHRAVRYRKPGGGVDYYAPDGTSMRKAFLRTPVEFTRISSRYGRRYHPILHRTRMHRGVDFAAARGTPIHATGAGRIVFRGRNGGFGNMIAIRHPGPYETRYGHMTRFARGLHVGSRVDQGDIIGYVGSTGLSTGPHLHYDFQVNGRHVNPLQVDLPSAKPIADQRLEQFRHAISPMVAKLGTLERAYVQLEQ